MENQKYFLNELQLKDKNIHILDPDDGYAENFGKQWKIYQNVQIDSFNNFNISENFLKKIIFNELLYLKNKTVLEIGCGSGRFTEHIVKFAKECVSIDMSSAIYYNVARGSNNLMLIKADFTKLLANNKISIERVIQLPDLKKKSASIVIITHKAFEYRSQNLINSLKKNVNVLKKPILIRLF